MRSLCYKLLILAWIVPLLSVVGLQATTCAALLSLDRQIQGLDGGSGDTA